MKKIYEIMHKNRRVARIDGTGHCKIYYKSFMPYNLYLEEQDDFDTLVNNVTNFYYWCATRILTLDRKYAKEILNSIGMKQAVTDRDRAAIALSYRCVSLTDVFWVKRYGEALDFSDINLYENHLDNAFVDISLRGKQYTVQNGSLARDLSTNGVFPKAWVRRDDGFVLLKDGGDDAVEREVLASSICRCFDVSQVLYEKSEYDGEAVSASRIMTNPERSIVPMEHFSIYSANHNRNLKKYILKLDRHNYYMMNIMDYLIGNTDRHWGNWGFVVDNLTNKPLALHKLMDFNQAFNAYDTMNGGSCQTTLGEPKTQLEAAVEAVKKIGLNQVRPIEERIFDSLPEYRDMFFKRLELLSNS